MFEQTLRSVISNCEGAVGALIMGLDGICVARADCAEPEIDIDVVAAEYTTLLRKALRSLDDVAVGQLRELVVSAGKFSFLIKPITGEYYLVLVLRAPSGLGRARFELRKAQLTLEEEFSV